MQLNNLTINRIKNQIGLIDRKIQKSKIRFIAPKIIIENIEEIHQHGVQNLHSIDITFLDSNTIPLKVYMMKARKNQVSLRKNK